MSKLQPMICENCGGKISNNHCSYCGTRYLVSDPELYLPPVIIEEAKADIIRTKFSIPWDMLLLDEQTIADYSTEKIKQQLAEALVPYIEMQTAFDPHFNQTSVYGRVRVCKPGTIL